MGRVLRSLRLPALCLCAAAAACSTLPEAGYPRFVDHEVTAEFVVPDSGELACPATHDGLIVQHLELSPLPHGERFADKDERWLLYPAGTRVQLRGRFRAFARADGSVPSPADLLPHARVRSSPP